MVTADLLAAADPWRFHTHPEVWLVLLVAGGGYWWALARLPARLGIAEDQVATRRQRLSFWSGFAFVGVFSSWPIHDIAEKYLYSVHMAQHMVFTLIAPPLLLLGIPAWLTRWILRPAALRGFATRFARPMVAGVMFSAFQAFVHWPLLVNTSLEHEWVHFLVHFLLFSSAMLMWFPVLNKDPEYPMMSHPTRIMYLFAQSIIPNVPVAFLAFATTPVYSFYAHVARPFGGDAVTDQQVAAAIMKVGGTTLIWSIILFMFFSWYESEQNPPSPTLPEVLTWDDVEHALAASEPRSS